jgi:hypothetical protein
MDKFNALIVHKIVTAYEGQDLLFEGKREGGLQLLRGVVGSEPDDRLEIELLEEGKIEDVRLSRTVQILLHHAPVDGRNVVRHPSR